MNAFHNFYCRTCHAFHEDLSSAHLFYKQDRQCTALYEHLCYLTNSCGWRWPTPPSNVTQESRQAQLTDSSACFAGLLLLERDSPSHSFHKQQRWLGNRFWSVITKRAPCLLHWFWLSSQESPVSRHHSCFYVPQCSLPLSITMSLCYLHGHSCCLTVPLPMTKSKVTKPRCFRQRPKDWYFLFCAPLCHMGSELFWWVSWLLISLKVPDPHL